MGYTIYSLWVVLRSRHDIMSGMLRLSLNDKHTPGIGISKMWGGCLRGSQYLGIIWTLFGYHWSPISNLLTIFWLYLRHLLCINPCTLIQHTHAYVAAWFKLVCLYKEHAHAYTLNRYNTQINNTYATIRIFSVNTCCICQPFMYIWHIGSKQHNQQPKEKQNETNS